MKVYLCFIFYCFIRIFKQANKYLLWVFFFFPFLKSGSVSGSKSNTYWASLCTTSTNKWQPVRGTLKGAAKCLRKEFVNLERISLLQTLGVLILKSQTSKLKWNVSPFAPPGDEKALFMCIAHVQTCMNYYIWCNLSELWRFFCAIIYHRSDVNLLSEPQLVEKCEGRLVVVAAEGNLNESTDLLAQIVASVVWSPALSPPALAAGCSDTLPPSPSAVPAAWNKTRMEGDFINRKWWEIDKK